MVKAGCGSGTRGDVAPGDLSSSVGGQRQAPHTRVPPCGVAHELNPVRILGCI